MSPESRATRRIGPARRLAIDLPATFNLVATLVTYLAFAVLVPAAVALWYREPPWPFLGAFALVGGLGLVVQRATRGAGTVGFREGYLVVALTWLAAAVVRRAALPALGGRAARPARRRALRVDVGLHDHRGDDPRRRRRGRPLASVLAAAHPVARRHGDHRARPRRAAPPARRRPPAARIRDARAGDGLRRAHPLHRAPAVAALRGPDGGDDRDPHRLRAHRDRPPDGTVRGGLGGVRHAPDRRLHAR